MPGGGGGCSGSHGRLLLLLLLGLGRGLLLLRRRRRRRLAARGTWRGGRGDAFSVEFNGVGGLSVLGMDGWVHVVVGRLEANVVLVVGYFLYLVEVSTAPERHVGWGRGGAADWSTAAALGRPDRLSNPVYGLMVRSYRSDVPWVPCKSAVQPVLASVAARRTTTDDAGSPTTPTPFADLLRRPALGSIRFLRQGVHAPTHRIDPSTHPHALPAHRRHHTQTQPPPAGRCAVRPTPSTSSPTPNTPKHNYVGPRAQGGREGVPRYDLLPALRHPGALPGRHLPLPPGKGWVGICGLCGCGDVGVPSQLHDPDPIPPQSLL